MTGSYTPMNPYLTFCVASYAAVLSTLVFLWDIAKWKANRARLKIRVEDHARPVYNLSTRGPDVSTWKTVTITNVGAQTTTLKAVWIIKYHHFFDFEGQKGELQIDNRGSELPFTLEPGKQWDGYPRGPEESLLTSNNQLTYVMVTHSMSNEPTRLKIKGARSC